MVPEKGQPDARGRPGEVKKKKFPWLIVGGVVVVVAVAAVLLLTKKKSSETTPVSPSVKTYEFETAWGSLGSGDGQFNNPAGIVVDSSGNIFVADFYNHRIQKFTSSGVFITKWGSQGSGNGQFDRPEGVAVDSSGNVYVADTYNHRIQKFH